MYDIRIFYENRPTNDGILLKRTEYIWLTGLEEEYPGCCDFTVVTYLRSCRFKLCPVLDLMDIFIQEFTENDEIKNEHKFTITKEEINNLIPCSLF